MANELKRIKQAYQNLTHKAGYKCGLGELNYAEKQDFETLEKHEKALKIIKKKGVDVWWLQTVAVVSAYNERFDEKCAHLTRCEFDLLKEVLL